MHNNNDYQHPQDIVDEFGEYFFSVFSSSNDNMFVSDQLKPPHNIFVHQASVTEDDICRAIERMKSNYCLGLDGIPAFFVKYCSPTLIQPLKYIFNTHA